ncbi:MAG: hypothetical protein KGK07_07315 [Chloroflexota bacterium]|nr:hypothetical protein [Chloroflexota bacterium]
MSTETPAVDAEALCDIEFAERIANAVFDGGHRIPVNKDLWVAVARAAREAVPGAAVAPYASALRETVKRLHGLRDSCLELGEHREWCASAVDSEARILQHRIDALLGAAPAQPPADPGDGGDFRYHPIPPASERTIPVHIVRDGPGGPAPHATGDADHGGRGSDTGLTVGQALEHWRQRATRAEAALERVRALAERWRQSDGDGDVDAAFTVRSCASEVLAILDGGVA